MLKDYLKLHKFDESYTDNIVENINNCNFKAILIALNEIMAESRSLIDNLQEYRGFINDEFFNVQ